MSGLIDQASRGNLKAVRDLINTGVNVDVQDKQRRTALMLSSQKGYLDIVKTLVNAGAALNLQGNERGYGGNTALMYACRHRHLEVVKTLVNAGTNLNLQSDQWDCKGYTALIYAAYDGCQEIVKALVDAGANVNIKDELDKRTALIISSEKSHLEIVKVLIDAGADLNVQNIYGKTALIHASRKGYLEVVKTLIQAGANVNLQGQAEYTSEKGWTALIHASRVGHLEVVKSLIQAEADLHLKTAGGWTALMHASDQGHKEAVKILEDAESKDLRFARARKTLNLDPKALIRASKLGHLEVVRSLIEAGADLNLKTEEGWTALMYACENDHLEVVKSLVNARADVNVQNQFRQTALMRASRKGYLRVVRSLVDSGVDVNVQSKNGWTALIAASKARHLEIVEVLVDAGAELNLKTKVGWTALMYACGNGYLEVVNSLIQRRSDVNIQNRYGETALIHASRVGHLEIVKSLIEVGADLNLKTEEGWTALMYASRKLHREVVTVLRTEMVFGSLFTVLGYLSTVDGQVSRQEVDFVEDLMNGMKLDSKQRCRAKNFFHMGMQISDITLVTLLIDLKKEYKNIPKSLHRLIKIFMELVYLNNAISKQKRLAITKIAKQLEIPESVLDNIEESFLSKPKGYKASNRSSQSQYSKRGSQSTEEAEINPDHYESVKISTGLFEISGYLAKLDGRISPKEIKAITGLMDEMELERDQRRQAEDLFRRGKHSSEESMINLVSNLQDQYHETPEVLNILVMILMQVAYSDGDMIDSEQQMIRTIAMQLSLDEIALSIIEAAVCCEIQNIKYLDLRDAYKMIGVSEVASDHDIKKARLRLLRTYHPDALQAKGLPKEMLVFGKRLSQTFNLAYDRIKADRKF